MARLQWIRTNHVALNILLSNWVYRTSDKFELIYKQNSNPRGNWAAFMATAVANSAALYIQYNLYGSRRVMNFAHSGIWSGDASYSYDSPYDNDNYYRIVVDGSDIGLYKGTTIDETTTRVITASLGSESDTDTLPIYLFVTNGTNTLDVFFYSLKVWRNDILIHEYVPCNGGVLDIVTDTEFLTSTTGYVDGPEYIPPVPPAPGFPVTIQRNNSESIHLDKDLTNILTTQAVLKSDTSLIDPVLLIEVNLATVALANYVTIPQFNRSYFITNIRSVTNDLVELTCHVDVLSSFAEEIRANTGIIRRNENDWNLYLNDGTLISYQNPIVTTQKFPNGFTEQSFVLVVAGSREGGVNVGEGGSTSVSPTESEEMGGAGNVNSKTTGGLVVYATQQLGKPYWFGTFGNTATQTLLDFKRNPYPSYFPDPGDPPFASQLGERVHDCVGLVKGYRWRENPTNADPVYTLSEDVDATGLYNQCIKHRGIVHPDTPAMEYPIGCVFFYAPDSNGNIQHCGVYIGNGNIIEARGHRYGVVQSNISQRTQFALWGIPDWMQVTTTYG